MNALAEEQQLRITKIKDHIGAEVTGIDLRQPLDAATRQQIYDALVENVAVVIRDQHFTPTQYREAAEQFGELMEDQNRLYLAEGEPLVSVLSNRLKASDGQPAKVGANATWHTDHTNQERPPKFTCLYAVELPDSGGGTSVCNMRAAYEALPAEERARLDGMKTANTLISSARFKIANPDILKAQLESKTPPMVHPLVRTHPDSGTKAIWFHKSKTETVTGLNAEETQDFLEDLLQRAIKPEFACVHEWRLGDMLMIDNRAAMHKAGHDFDHSQHRHLLRILVRGDRPV
jgi:taurine dioxygenase